jgi:hypothetical protein
MVGGPATEYIISPQQMEHKTSGKIHAETIRKFPKSPLFSPQNKEFRGDVFYPKP